MRPNHIIATVVSTTPLSRITNHCRDVVMLLAWLTRVRRLNARLGLAIGTTRKRCSLGLVNTCNTW